MSETLSRWLAAAEGLVIGVPATVVWLVLIGFLGTISAEVAQPARDALVLINLCIVSVALWATWWLLFVFVRSGAARLARQPQWLWVAMALGAAVIVIGWIVNSLGGGAMHGATGAFSLFGVRFVTILPVLHLVAEGVLRAKSR